jgi:hypothetical protein
MKKLALVLGVVFLGGLLVTQVFAHGPGGSNRGGYGNMMGPGMMGGGMMGRGMGPGMMGGGMMGRGMGRGMMSPGNEPQYQQPRNPMEEEDAKVILQNYLQSMRNPNLKLGKIKDMGNAFEAEILTKDNSLVDKILVDKNTGSMRSVY